VSETGKSCGDCGLCCKLMGVEAIAKDAGRWCGHFRKGGGGCGIYADRPQACRDFACMWLTSDRLDDAWKPNKAHLILHTDQDGRRLNVVVDPADPTAWKREPYYARIKAMSARAEDGYELMVCVGQRRFVIFPHEDVDLGIVDPEQKIVSGYAMIEGERTPYAMILSDVQESPRPA
jgi:uncharacterized cysteine cluster protein YcgN (CxxCxxCC family)